MDRSIDRSIDPLSGATAVFIVRGTLSPEGTRRLRNIAKAGSDVARAANVFGMLAVFCSHHVVGLKRASTVYAAEVLVFLLRPLDSDYAPPLCMSAL